MNAVAKTLALTAAVAAVAAIGAWIVTAAIFEPQVTATFGIDGEVTYADNRHYCSGGVTMPSTSGGVRVEPTMPSHCRGGPISSELLNPSPVPAIAMFLLVASLGLVPVGFMLSSTSTGQSLRRQSSALPSAERSG